MNQIVKEDVSPLPSKSILKRNNRTKTVKQNCSTTLQAQQSEGSREPKRSFKIQTDGRKGDEQGNKEGTARRKGREEKNGKNREEQTRTQAFFLKMEELERLEEEMRETRRVKEKRDELKLKNDETRTSRFGAKSKSPSYPGR